MTKLFEQALAAVRSLDPQEQDRIAEMMLAMSQTTEPETVPTDQLQAVLEGLADAQDGRFASHADVCAAFKRFDV